MGASADTEMIRDLSKRLVELAKQHFAVAEQLAINIAQAKCHTVDALIAKAELLQELAHTETIGADRAEKYIINALPDDIRRVFGHK